MTQGRALLAQQQTDEARDALQRAQALNPNLPLIDIELGAVYLRLDMPQQAEAAYRRAVDRDTESAEAHSGLAIALQRQGKRMDALAMHQNALRMAPGNSTVRSNLASFYIEQGDLAAASAQLEEGYSQRLNAASSMFDWRNLRSISRTCARRRSMLVRPFDYYLAPH
jgi:Flp pilus assembly protein TadD